jgi:hypothetical protein
MLSKPATTSAQAAPSASQAPVAESGLAPAAAGGSRIWDATMIRAARLAGSSQSTPNLKRPVSCSQAL